jgi:hypothetical protein
MEYACNACVFRRRTVQKRGKTCGVDVRGGSSGNEEMHATRSRQETVFGDDAVTVSECRFLVSHILSHSRRFWLQTVAHIGRKHE